MLSMRTLVLFAIVAMAVDARHPPRGGSRGSPPGGKPPRGGSGGPPPGGPGGEMSSEAKACKDALKPSVTKEEKKAFFEECVAEQDGLQAIIDGLEIPRGRNRHHALMEALEVADSAAALTLRQCLAGKLGDVVEGSTEFDIETFKATLLERVAGTTSETNVQLGLDSCPTDALVEFKVHEYMRCIMAYCATGEAPPAPPAA